MLRLSIAQQCFRRSDEGSEDAIDESQSIRGFVGIDLTSSLHRTPPPCASFAACTTNKPIVAAVNTELAAKGLTLKDGTVGYATIIATPSSTKNRGGERDPEMHQTKKVNQWHFVRACASHFARPPQAVSCGLRPGGMKAHNDVDAKSGITLMLLTSAANVQDVTEAHALLHGQERVAFGDAGYQGVEKRQEVRNGVVRWKVALPPGKRRAQPTTMGRLLDEIEQLKAGVRAKVEHVFHIVKNILGMKKARDQGWVKNTAQRDGLFGLANLLIAKRQWLALNAQGAS